MLNIYLSVLAQFLTCIILQILVWRTLRQPDGTMPRQILWLFALFLGGPLVLLTTTGSPAAFILAVGLGCTYIMSFPAASAKSPSLLILNILDKRGPLTEAELSRALNSGVGLVEDRLSDLRSDGLIKPGETEFKPSALGRSLGYIFWTYRRLLGLPLGEG